MVTSYFISGTVFRIELQSSGCMDQGAGEGAPLSVVSRQSWFRVQGSGLRVEG